MDFKNITFGGVETTAEEAYNEIKKFLEALQNGLNELIEYSKQLLDILNSDEKQELKKLETKHEKTKSEYAEKIFKPPKYKLNRIKGR